MMLKQKNATFSSFMDGIRAESILKTCPGYRGPYFLRHAIGTPHFSFTRNLLPYCAYLLVTITFSQSREWLGLGSNATWCCCLALLGPCSGMILKWGVPVANLYFQRVSVQAHCLARPARPADPARTDLPEPCLTVRAIVFGPR
jgi:hypothetical protein